MEKMEKRFFKVMSIAIVLMAYMMCVVITWFVDINTIVNIVLIIAYGIILLFAGIDFYHMVDSMDTKVNDVVDDMTREDKIFSYHLNSAVRNLTICLCVLCILLAYEAFLYSMIIWVIIFILLAFLLLIFAIHSHLKAMKDVNVFNTDD